MSYYKIKESRFFQSVFELRITSISPPFLPTDKAILFIIDLDLFDPTIYEAWSLFTDSNSDRYIALIYNIYNIHVFNYL